MIRFPPAQGALAVVLVLLLTSALPASAQVYEGQNLVRAALVADVSQAARGSTFRVGLVLDQAEGWHTYWQYAGDSGLATKIDWMLPEGVQAGPILWPVPMRLVEPGDLVVYAYKDQVVLFTDISVPEDFAGDKLTIRAVAKWLVCREICIPGEAELEIRVPVGAEAEPLQDDASAAVFGQFLAMLPGGPGTAPFRASFSMDGGVSRVVVEGWQPAGDVLFAPLPAADQVIGHVETTREVESTQTVFATPVTGGPQRPVPGVVVEVLGDGSRRGWMVAPDATATATQDSPAAAGAGPHSEELLNASAQPRPSLWQFLVYGLLGGLILNLMPCVLPVISLKVFGFMKQADESPARILRLGLVFSSGVFVWFLGLAAVIVGLRAAGEQVNWAFQFQNSVFLLLVCGLLVVFALNLFGVFEIILPGAATRGLTRAAGREGYTGTFLHGLLATILATPCTAPFLGTALGFAFSQSAPVVFAMFASVAFGMSLPFLLLSARPGWMRYLPRPGRWMESLKQFMGFPLLATLVWLIWVLGNQGGIGLVTRALAWLLALSIACWVIGRFASPSSARRTKVLAWLAALLLAFGGWFAFLPSQAFAERSTTDAISSELTLPGSIAWQPFSREAIQRELAAGRVVFVDFTAEWCLTCKFNERTVIDTPETRRVVSDLDVAMLKGDWTNADPAIGEFLAEHGRVGVPFYIVFSPHRPRQPKALPELLTKSMLAAALEQAAAP